VIYLDNFYFAPGVFFVNSAENKGGFFEIIKIVVWNFSGLYKAVAKEFIDYGAIVVYVPLYFIGEKYGVNQFDIFHFRKLGHLAVHNFFKIDLCLVQLSIVQVAVFVQV
jgi:hypothetical protein